MFSCARFFSVLKRMQGLNYFFGSGAQLRGMREHCKLLHWGFGGEALKDVGQNAIQMRENGVQCNNFWK